jgi:hypothetical protein
MRLLFQVKLMVIRIGSHDPPCLEWLPWFEKISEKKSRSLEILK